MTTTELLEFLRDRGHNIKGTVDRIELTNIVNSIIVSDAVAADMVREAESNLSNNHTTNTDTSHQYSASNTSTDEDILNTSTWELMKRQIKQDFAPFLILIPPPVKRFLKRIVEQMLKKISSVVYGATGPMIKTAGRLLTKIGRSTSSLGQKLLNVDDKSMQE
eukprot:CAMPEP_0182427758 /NCGR_PEP_ID=MMETSP1167-20130531/19294_1 /TAXON_ID=2988 /ORGANISM="Mallomonas Sp, Strain CCMP3275" /LENGTH=162 /DNA_ID=CAMNT_0024610217 /DNA_START=249 /DNA_END=737 /DNA_ORIENTATION=+